jgi:CSLREA domain-containing protein
VHRTVGLAAIASTLALAAPAFGATISVTSTDDNTTAGSGCTLREALNAANNDTTGGGDCTQGSGADVIQLPAGTITVNLFSREDANAGGDFDIAAPVTIAGAGSATTTVDGAQYDRVFDIQSGITATIKNLTVTDGATLTGGYGNPGGNADPGGGIRSAGTLTLDHVVVTANTTGNGGDGSGVPANGGAGGVGGGVYSSGTLTLLDSTVSWNTTGSGGDGGGPASCTSTGSSGGSGGYGGEGGGIWANALTLTRTAVTSNTAGDGGTGACAPSPGGGGTGGRGGGVRVAYLTMTDSSVTGNHSGTGGTAGFDGDGANGASSGDGGKGGGIFVSNFFNSVATISGSTISGNTTGYGGSGTIGTPSGSAGTGPGGRGGNGGGIWVLDDSSMTTPFTLTNSTVADNQTGGGGQSVRGSSGLAGDGGGLAAENFQVGNKTYALAGDTFSGNTTGTGGDLGDAGHGGGVYVDAATDHITLTANNSTFTANNPKALVMYKHASVAVNHVTVASNIGGGIQGEYSGVTDSSVSVTNSVISSNGSYNCEYNLVSPFVDGGHNVIFGVHCGTIQPGSADPLLGALANNGGPTKTMALLTGSPAIDLVPATGSSCLATDQRGTARPQGPACEAGAFEVFVPPPVDTGGGGDGGGGGGGGSGSTDTSTPPPTDTTPTETFTTVPRPDTRAPVVTLRFPAKQTLRSIIKKGFVCTFKTDEVGAFTVKFGTLGTLKLSATQTAASQHCVLKLSKKAKAKLAKLKKLTVTVSITSKDDLGNTATVKKTLRLKR